MYILIFDDYDDILFNKCFLIFYELDYCIDIVIVI